MNTKYIKLTHLFFIFTELMKTESMFEPHLMDSFMVGETPSDEVAQAWYIFVYKLLPLVNEFWFKLMKSNYVSQAPNMYEHTTQSDQALVRWVILCKIERLKYNKSKNWPALDPQQKGKKKGPHDSNRNKLLYITEYDKVKKTFRENEPDKTKQAWNNLCWGHLYLKHPEKFTQEASPRAKIDNDALIMPDEDE